MRTRRFTASSVLRHAASRGSWAAAPATLLVLALLAAPSASPAETVDAALARGDAAWTARAEGHRGDGTALREPIERAIRAYESAVATAPDRLDAHWKLLRAATFAGEFASSGAGQRRVDFDRAVQATRSAFEALAGAGGGRDPESLEPDAVPGTFPRSLHADVAGVYFWAAIAWGGWSRSHGLLDAVRRGVSGRLHHHASAVVALDPGYERGGALRLLARLHATLPRIPLLSGWVDRAQAMPLAERALSIAPDFDGNRLLLALTLFDVAPERRAEGIALLEQVAAADPDPAFLVEELSIRRAARERLAQEAGVREASGS